MPPGLDQAQLDALFTAALEAGIARIEKDGTFFPLLFELRANGAIQNVAVLETGAIDGAQTVLDRFAELLKPRAREGTIRAAAIVLHHATRDMMEVRLRATNYASDVQVPFAIARGGLFARKRKLTLGEFTLRAAENEIF